MANQEGEDIFGSGLATYSEIGLNVYWGLDFVSIWNKRKTERRHASRSGVDIAARKITMEQEGTYESSQKRRRRAGKDEGRNWEREKGNERMKRSGRKHARKRRLPEDSTVTERDKGEGNATRFYRLPFDFTPSFLLRVLLHPSHSFCKRDAQSIAICRPQDMVVGDIRWLSPSI